MLTYSLLRPGYVRLDLPRRHRDRCSPYFASGEGSHHFDSSQPTPPCPGACQPRFPKSLSESKFKPVGVGKSYRRAPPSPLEPGFTGFRRAIRCIRDSSRGSATTFARHVNHTLLDVWQGGPCISCWGSSRIRCKRPFFHIVGSQRTASKLVSYRNSIQKPRDSSARWIVGHRP